MSRMNSKDREELITIGFAFSVAFATMFVIFTVMFCLPIEEPFPSFSLMAMIISLAGTTMGIPAFRK